MTSKLYLGDCLDVLKRIPGGSVDAVVTDPPYPEIDRAYGRMTEAAWHEMMHGVVRETRRILKPRGSAVFVLQPNFRKIGSTRLWLWEFMVWAGREWNLIQDAYWWNFTALPTAGAERHNGLLRKSIKPCVWVGPKDCLRNQDSILWSESDGNKAMRKVARANRTSPSGKTVFNYRMGMTSVDRGGVTPFDLIPCGGCGRWDSGGVFGHGASTPFDLCDWWVRYISPPGGVVCDPFMGSGTVGLASLARGRSFVGVEKMPTYFAIAKSRITAARRAARKAVAS